jgi:hypothetical protein
MLAGVGEFAGAGEFTGTNAFSCLLALYARIVWLGNDPNPPASPSFEVARRLRVTAQRKGEKVSWIPSVIPL